MSERFRTRKFTPRPEIISTAGDRGQALRNWLDIQRTSIKAFAANLGMARSTLTLYLNGAVQDNRTYDLASLPQPQAAKLIETMNVTDFEAWDILGIPEASRATFRTFRPFPEGHGTPVQNVMEMRLSEPMVGEVPLPAGTLVRIDPAGTAARIQIVRLEDGRLYSVTPAVLERVAGEHLGGLLSAHF